MHALSSSQSLPLPKTHILFVCGGDACRSQMAEGWAQRFGNEWIDVRAASVEAPVPDPRAIAVMREAGVDISGEAPRRLSAELLRWADIVVTVCRQADYHCERLPAHVRKEHWPVADPAALPGPETEVLTHYRQARDEVRRRVDDLIRGLRRGYPGR